MTCFCLLSTALGFLFSSALHAKAFDYIYITASEGNASGGHTALRFDDETYHFQHYDGGIIRLIKDTSTDFDFQYRYLENRTFHQAALNLNDSDYEQLLNHFSLHFLLQKQQDDIRKEINLNIALLNNQTQHSQLNIKGAGLFSIKAVPRKTESLTNYQLQQQINQKYGADFLTQRIVQLKSEVNALHPEPWPKNSLQLSEVTFSPIPYSFASHYLDSISKILLLETIKNNYTLNPQHYFSPEPSLFILSQAEISQLKRFQLVLSHNLLTLINSQRPDWGNAAFSLYARIISLSLSIESGKFVFLDTFRDSSPVIDYTEVARYETKLLAQKNNALARIVQIKAALFTEQHIITEKTYGQLEMLSNYYYEREHHLQNKQGIRISGEQLLASKSISLPEMLLPKITDRQIAEGLARFEAYQQSIEQQLHALYGYDLFTRNCVTEITRTISHLPTNNQQIKELSQLTDKNIISFIPFGSFRNLSDDYTKQALPSFRHQQLAAMYREENSAIVFLREFNTLSATDYKFNDQDAAFLIFTDDNILMRPIFGSINLVAATIMGLYGSFSLAFDSGKALKDGTMGILMSLPELAFFNIRKGSYKHLSFPAN